MYVVVDYKFSFHVDQHILINDMQVLPSLVKMDVQIVHQGTSFEQTNRNPTPIAQRPFTF